MPTKTSTTRKLQVQLEHTVTRDQVMAVMEYVFKQCGCMTCGIRGVDLTLIGATHEQPTETGLSQLQGLPGVAGAIG